MNLAKKIKQDLYIYEGLNASRKFRQRMKTRKNYRYLFHSNPEIDCLN